LFLVGVLDVSGSMIGSKLTMVQASLRSLVASMNDEDTFALVAFNDEVEIALEPTRMTTAGKRSANQAIDALSATGETYPELGLAKAMAMFEGVTGNRALVYVGDGQSSDFGDRSWSKDQDNWQGSPALRTARSIRDAGISVYSGGIKLDNQTEAFLVELAGADANFKQVNDPDDLNGMLAGVKKLADLTAISNAKLELQTVKFASVQQLALVTRGQKAERYFVDGDVESRSIALGPIVQGDKLQACATFSVTLPANIGNETRAFGKAKIIGDVPAFGLTGAVLATADIEQEFSLAEKAVVNPRVKFIMAIGEALREGFQAASRVGSDVSGVAGAARTNFANATAVFNNADLANALSLDELSLIDSVKTDLANLERSGGGDEARKQARSATTTFDAGSLGL